MNLSLCSEMLKQKLSIRNGRARGSGMQTRANLLTFSVTSTCQNYALRLKNLDFLNLRIETNQAFVINARALSRS